ncbi:MAG: folate family ECF transporter S component [Anaerovoracaceae bacterium]
MSDLKNIRVLTCSAMLLAAAVILGFLKIPVNSLVEIRFQSVPVAAAGILLGPVMGGIIGALTDVLSYAVRPTGPYFPGFTISTAMTGIIFGLMMYGKHFDFKRLALTQITDAAAVSFLLNSLWLSMLYGVTFRQSFIMRLPKNFVMLPIDIAILFVIMKPVYRYAYQVLPKPGSLGKRS